MADADAIRRMLDERILVLDGAWGTMLQTAGLAPRDYRGEIFGEHPHDVAGDPDVLNLTRPDLVLDIHRRYLAAGADITTTNTFTATSIGQADYGLEGVGQGHEPGGRRLARQAADEASAADGSRRLVAGSVGPLNVTLSLSPRVDDPAYRTVTFDRVHAAYAEQMSALAEGGVDLLLVETIFDTLNAKAAIAAARDVAPQLPLWISVTIVDLSGRTLSGQTVEAFWTSDRARRAADRRGELLARRRGDAPARGGAVPAGGHLRQQPPERGTAERVRRLRRAAARDRGPAARVRRGGHGQRRRRLLRHHARRTSSRSPRRWPGCRGASCRPPAATSRFSGLEPFEIGPDTGFVMIGERTNVAGSARFRRLIEAGNNTGRRRRRARAGPRRGEPAGRQHGRRPARRRAGDDRVPQLHRDRARGRPDPGHDRQLAVERAGGRAQVRAGQGHRQLDQPQGGRGGVPRARPRGPRLRRRRGGDGLRRAGPGRHRRAEGVDLRPRLRPADPAGRLRARGHRLRPERARRRHRDRGAQRLRQGVHRGAAADQGALPGRAGSAAASPTCRSPSAATTSCARRCTRRSCSTRSGPGSTWASSTPASSSSTRTSRPTCWSWSRT